MESAATPRIRVRAATPADADVISQLHFAAFETSILMRLLHPGGITDDARSKFAAQLFPAADPNTTSAEDTLVVVAELLPEEGPEDGQGEVVACGKCLAYRKPRTEEEWNTTSEFTLETVGEGADPDMYNHFVGGLQKMRREHLKGGTGLVFTGLAVDPKRGHLGAGSAVIRCGTELADKEGLVSWLEATPTGYPLYLRHGFKPVAVYDLDIAKLRGVVYGGTEDWGSRSATETFGPRPEGAFRSVMMRREPLKQVASRGKLCSLHL